MLDKIMSLDLSNLITIMIFFISNIGLLCLYLFCAFIAETADKYGFKDYTYTKNMDECVQKAAEIAAPGDTVLLSPACASWDMYQNFEQRGDHFKMCVERL